MSLRPMTRRTPKTSPAAKAVPLTPGAKASVSWRRQDAACGAGLIRALSGAQLIATHE